MTSLESAPLGVTCVEAFCPSRGKRWIKGKLVGRTKEENPKFDVMLVDRTILASIPREQIRVVE